MSVGGAGGGTLLVTWSNILWFNILFTSKKFYKLTPEITEDWVQILNNCPLNDMED